MKVIILISTVISFLTVWFLTPWLIRYLRKIDLVVQDQNKEGKPLVPISGGLAVVAGFFAGLLTFIFIRTFFPVMDGLILNDFNLNYIFAGMLSILIITIVGFVDDLVIKKTKESAVGLNQWQKPLLTLSAAIPLIAIMVGETTMTFPIIGRINMGVLYPLLFVPIGVVGAANMVNMLGGLNGLETGMGIIYMGVLGLYAYTNERYIAALIALMVFIALIAFFYYNKYPARILPGNSLTYFLGGSLAVIAIIGDIERAAIVLAIPFFIEFILKLRSKLKADSFGYYKDGKLHSKYDKVYSLTHIFLRTGKFSEKQIVWFFIVIELIISSFIWFV